MTGLIPLITAIIGVLMFTYLEQPAASFGGGMVAGSIVGMIFVVFMEMRR